MNRYDNVVIVLNYNDFETTIELINKIKFYQVIEKIVIVDNCSTDESYNEFLTIKNDKIDVIKTEGNYGYAYGNNYGIKYVHEKYKPKKIIICNPDIIVEENVLSKLLDNINQNVVATSAMMRNSELKLTNGSAWRLPTYKDQLVNSMIILSKFIKPSYKYDLIEKNKGLVEVDVLTGSLVVFSAEALKSVEGYDEDTFLYHEENILFSKFKMKGYKVVLDTDIDFIHNHQTSVKKNLKKDYKIYWICRSSSRVYIKKCLGISGIKLCIHDICSILGLIELIIKSVIKGRF